MVASLVGIYVIFNDQFARLGRFSAMTTAVGMAIMSVLLLRRVVLFVDAGFRVIPATGADPAGLLLSVTTVLGLALTVIGAGGIGLALRRTEIFSVITSRLLLLAPILPGILIGFNQLIGLPLPVGRLIVRTNVILVPFGFAWIALGLHVWFYARSTSRSTAE
jgi:NADH:ubiquinone oxidoreductase subunit K